jgi:hypothetical protein
MIYVANTANVRAVSGTKQLIPSIIGIISLVISLRKTIPPLLRWKRFLPNMF